MAYESRTLSLKVGQAAHHLHSLVTGIATAMIDIEGNGRMLFSNSALIYVDGGTLTNLARAFVTLSDHENLPHCYQHELDHAYLYLIVLDERHVFVVVGKPKDEMMVQEFTEQLRVLLRGMTAQAG